MSSLKQTKLLHDSLPSEAVPLSHSHSPTFWPIWLYSQSRIPPRRTSPLLFRPLSPHICTPVFNYCLEAHPEPWPLSWAAESNSNYPPSIFTWTQPRPCCTAVQEGMHYLHTLTSTPTDSFILIHMPPLPKLKISCCHWGLPALHSPVDWKDILSVLFQKGVSGSSSPAPLHRVPGGWSCVVFAHLYPSQQPFWLNDLRKCTPWSQSWPCHSVRTSCTTPHVPLNSCGSKSNN